MEESVLAQAEVMFRRNWNRLRAPGFMQAVQKDCAGISWLCWYARFHHRYRYSPTSKYIIYSCRERQPGHRHCGGIGHRFTHIGFLLRAAAANRRIFLIDWASPEPLENYFIPAHLEWRLNMAEHEAIANERVHRFVWPNASSQPPPEHSQYLLATGGFAWAAACFGCANLTTPSFGSLFKFLFQSTEALESRLRALRVSVFGAATVAYNSMHVRMGDSADGSALGNNFFTPVRDARFSLAHAFEGISCVAGSSSLPLFVATDNAALKTAISAHNISRLLGSDHTVGLEVRRSFSRAVVHGCSDCMVNTVHKHNFSAESIEGIFADLGFLAGGRDFFSMGRKSNYATVVQAWRGPTTRNIPYPDDCAHPNKHGICPERECLDWRNAHQIGTTKNPGTFHHR